MFGKKLYFYFVENNFKISRCQYRDMEVFWFFFKTTSAIFVASQQQTGRERKAALPWAAQLAPWSWWKMGAKLRSIMGNTQILQETMTSAPSTTGNTVDPSALLQSDYTTNQHAQSNWAIKMNNINTMCNITHTISVLK